MKAPAFVLAAVLAFTPQQTTEQQLRELRDTITTRIDAILAGLVSTPTVIDPSGLQAAINSAVPGTTFYLRPGSVYGATVVRRSVRITTQGIQASTARVTAADAAGFAVVEPTGNLPAFDITASDVTIDNISIRGNVDTHIQCGSTSATSLDQQPTNVTLSRLYLDGTAGAKRGIGLHCQNATIKDSRIFGYRRVGQDTQAIGGWNGPGPYVISNNYLEAAGENVMFGGAAPGIAGMVPRNIQILANDFWKDPAWKAAGYTVKNHLELKVGEHVLVQGNSFENMWAAGQSYSIMLTPQAQDAENPNCIVADVTIEENTFVNVSGGIVIKGRQQLGTPCLQGSGFVVRRNWLPVDRTFNGGAAQGWVLFISGEPRDVTIEQNTFDTNGNQVVFHDGLPVFGFIYRGNLTLRCGAYGFSGWANGTTQHRAALMSTYFPGAVVTGNAFGSFPSPSNLPANLHVAASAITSADGYGTGDFAVYGRPRN